MDLAQIPSSAAKTPTGSMIIPPQTKPFLAVAASLAPSEICRILCSDKFTVTKVITQLAIVSAQPFGKAEPRDVSGQCLGQSINAANLIQLDKGSYHDPKINQNNV